MPDDRRIARVVIEQGCLFCNGCEMTCPEVFQVVDYTVRLTPDAAAHFDTKRAEVEIAALGCPLEVLIIEYTDGTSYPRPVDPSIL